MIQPYVFGQSGTERPEPVLVTMPPAADQQDREDGDERRRSGDARSWRTSPASRVLNVKVIVLGVLLAERDRLRLRPSFSCTASIV